PSCPQLCVIDACGAAGITKTACEAGRCVLQVSCDSSTVTCREMTPVCPAGQVPAVEGDCWTGACVDATQCSSVTDCTACGKGQVCVTYGTRVGPEYHCVERPPECGSAESCDC